MLEDSPREQPALTIEDSPRENSPAVSVHDVKVTNTEGAIILEFSDDGSIAPAQETTGNTNPIMGMAKHLAVMGGTFPYHL
jgi:hypothetical protein